jgi:hypothetical protein
MKQFEKKKSGVLYKEAVFQKKNKKSCLAQIDWAKSGDIFGLAWLKLITKQPTQTLT